MAPRSIYSSMRLRTTASHYRCKNCSPERVCAWACIQGASKADIAIGAALALEGSPGVLLPDLGVEPSRGALWISYNARP